MELEKNSAIESAKSVKGRGDGASLLQAIAQGDSNDENSPAAS